MLNQSPSINPIFHEVESKRLEPWLVEIVITIKESMADCHYLPCGSKQKSSTLKESHYLASLFKVHHQISAKNRQPTVLKGNHFVSHRLKILLPFEKYHHLCLILCYQSFLREKDVVVFLFFFWMALSQFGTRLVKPTPLRLVSTARPTCPASWWLNRILVEYRQIKKRGGKKRKRKESREILSGRLCSKRSSPQCRREKDGNEKGESKEKLWMIHNVCILQIFIRQSPARFNGQVELNRWSVALTG